MRFPLKVPWLGIVLIGATAGASAPISPAQGQSAAPSSLSASSEPKTEEDWADRLEQMKKDFDQAKVLQEGDGSPQSKADAWAKFQADYAADDPYSSEDDTMRQEADARVQFWKAEVTRAESPAPANILPGMGVAPEPAPDQPAGAQPTAAHKPPSFRDMALLAIALGACGLILGFGVSGLLHLARFRFRIRRLLLLSVAVPVIMAITGLWYWGVISQGWIPMRRINPFWLRTTVEIVIVFAPPLLIAVVPCLSLRRKPRATAAATT